MHAQLAYVKSDCPFTPSSITLGDLLRQAAGAAPDTMALLSLREANGAQAGLTYAQLLHRATSLARGLLEQFEPGDRIVIWSGNRFEWTICQFGAALAGLIVVAINPGCAKGELKYFIDQSQARGIILDPIYRGRNQLEMVTALRGELSTLEHVIVLDALEDMYRNGSAPLPEVSPHDPAMIQYTSGTTGKPKGALLSHLGLANATKASEETFQLKPHSVWLNTLPMYTTSGSVFVSLSCIWNSGTQVMLPTFDPELVCRAIEEERANYLPVVPTMALAILDHPQRPGRDFSSLEVSVIGGSAIAPSLVTRMTEDFGAEVFIVFGQTESCSALCLTKKGDSVEHKTQTIGYPLGGIELRIADPTTGQTLNVNETGEICVRAVSTMVGYYGMPEQTAQAMEADGWLHTGDLGTLRPDGYPTINGRLKEMIIRGGSNIYPREIEDILLQLDGVAEAAVFGLPDARYGEICVASVRVKPQSTITTEAVLAHIREHLAAYKVPSHVWFVDSFPLTSSGKIQKFELRQRFLTEKAPA